MLSRARSTLPGMAVAAMLVAPAFAVSAFSSLAFAAEPSASAGQPAPTPAATASASVSARPAPVRHAVTRGRPVAQVATRRAPPRATPSPVISDSTASTPPDAGTAAWRQIGVASYYGGPRWQGHLTSSGERYDEHKLTAAHASLPIGTRVRVTLEGSDRSVIVVINDRPGTRRRIIDLSTQAATELGILTQGIAVVTLTKL